MKSIFRLLLCLLLITTSVSVPFLSNAQCNLTNFFEPGVPSNAAPPCGAFGTGYSVGPGTQTGFQVLNGGSYSFSTCGSGFATGVSVVTASNVIKASNNGNGPFCATNRASLTWIADVTSTVFVVVTTPSCGGWNTSGGTSAVLNFRQDNNLVFTSSSADLCPGATRSLSATPAGGTFTGPNVSGSLFTAPSSGSSTITYTFGNCSQTQTLNVSSPQVQPSGATATPSTICSGATSALLAVGGSLGTGGSYQWYTGACGGTLIPGATGSTLNVTPTTTTNYFVRITGACSTTACAQVTVTVNSASTDPTGINTNNNGFCPGGNATLTVQGGSLGTGATWRWYEGSCCAGASIGSGNSITVTPTATTQYFVRAEGASCGNSNSATVTINVNTVSVAPTGISSTNGTLFCNGLGTTTLGVQGGSLGSGATWNWYTGTCGGVAVGTGTTINVNPTSSTTYFVRAEGTCPPPTGCAQITINVSAGLAITSINKTDVTCFGANDGTITVNATGGVTPYTYQWSPGSGGATRTNLAPGTYDVTVTDFVGCTVVGNSTTINQAPQLVITNVVKDDISCNGSNDGTITISASGGTGQLQYSINSGSTFQNSNQFTGLGAACYSIVVIDASNCVTVYQSNPVCIIEPLPVSIAVTAQTDASCSGVNDGTITVQATGGSGGFLYSLNGSAFQPGGLFGNLSAGNYTILAQDNSGCQATTTTSLANVTTLVLAVDTVIDVSCSGQGDGSFEVTASSGTSPYQYSINGITFQNSGVFSNLNGGTYTVLANDAAGCQVITQIVINEAPLLVVTVDSVTNLTCNGSNSGDVFISVSGGTPGTVATFTPLAGNVRNAVGLNDPTFSALSNGANTGRPDETGACCNAQNPPTDIFEFTVSASGSYTITNDYNAGFNGTLLLYTDPLDFTVSPPTSFVAGDDNCTAFFNSCVTTGLTAGQTYYLITTRNTGTATSESWTTTFTGPGNILESTGTTIGYTYLWSNGDITQDIDSVPAGNYTVTVTDGNGCTATTSVTITQPLPLTVSLANLAEVRCNGGTDGEIDITTTGGTPPYTYLWSNGITTEDNTNLTDGTYSVTVTDANGCIETDTYTITEPTAIAVTGTVTDAACGTSPNGAVDVTVSGGVGPYTYFWTNGQTTQDITGLTPGVYTVQVLDSRNCISSASFTVGGGSSLTLSVDTVINIGCFGDSTGAIEIIVSGGTAPVTFIWSNGATTQNISGLPAGTYAVTATDANGCQDALSATVLQPSAFFAVASVTNVGCNGNADGEIDVTVSGGTTPYTYTWSPAAGNVQDLTGLSGGTYSLTITDANGCTTNLTATVTEPTALNVQGAVSNVRCNGGNDGVINLSASGGVPSYTFIWSNGATSSSLFNLSGGTYTVTVTDANGCTEVQSFTVTEPAVVVASATGTNVSCPGGSNGTVSASATGGTGAYSYLWSNFNTNASQTGLAAGTYTVIVTDANGCTASAAYTVTQPQPIAITETLNNVTCNGGNNGSISISIAGGTGPYDVTWSNGPFTNGTTTSSNGTLAAGTYTVTVEDQNGCTATETYTITQPTAIALATQATNANCNGAATGAVDLTVSGGTPTYTYAWSNGATSQDLTGVAAGTYTVTVTDANGCTATTTATVGQPTAIALQASVVDADCNGATNGDIFLNVNGGTPSYTYAWSNGATTQNLLNVAAGTYAVTVTDANGCTATSSYTINQPAVVTSTVTVTNVDCFGDSTGTVNLSPAGGTAPYTFLWSNFSTSEDLSGVPAGTYYVVITDANGCNITDTAVITQNSLVVLNATITNVTCFGANNGSVLVSVTGGVAPYTYIWSSGGTAALESNLAPGTYTVTVTDDAGCSQTATYVITGPTQVVTSGVSTDISCNGANDGSIDLTVSGGVAPYVYLWSNNAVTEDINGLAAATYDVRVTDANGCIARDTFTIAEPAAIVTSIVGNDATCNGSGNGSATLTVSGGTAPYTFFWSNFRFTQNASNLTAGEYFVIVTDANGCQTVDSVTIGQPVVLEVTGSAKGAGCGNDARGAVDITVTGGTPPYGFLWSTGAVTEDITGLGTGTYCVTVTDDAGCQAFLCAVVTSFPLPVANFSSTLACDDQAVTFTNLSNVSSGPMTYLWDFDDNGATSTDQDPIYTFTTPGTYAVSLIAFSDQGCADTVTQSIVVNATPDATITSNGQTGTVCNGDSAVLTAPTGAGFTYLWNTNDSTQSITVTSSGIYSVTITSGALCNGIGSIEVGIFSQAAVTISPDTTISRGYSTTLEATGGISYEWSPAATLDNPFAATPVATPLDAVTTYTVTVTVSTGCVTTREVTVTLTDDFRVDLPNLFTPNGDGINDTWVISNIFTYNAEVFVFNRWGTEIFSTTNYQNDWGGTNNDGDELGDGTYYYVVKVGDKVYKGAITILR